MHAHTQTPTHTHSHTHTHRVLHYNCFIQDSVVSSFLLLLLLLPAPSSDLILLYHKDKTWPWSCSVSVNTDVRESSPGHSLWRHASPPVHLQRLCWLPAPRPGGVHGRPAAAHATCVHHLRKQGQGLLDRIWLYCMCVCEYIHAHMHHVYTSELDSSKGGGVSWPPLYCGVTCHTSSLLSSRISSNWRDQWILSTKKCLELAAKRKVGK